MIPPENEDRGWPRRRGVGRWVVLTVVSIGVALAAPAALACSCTQPAEPRTEMEHADAVFSGRVTALEPLADRGFRRLAVRFALAAVWKGLPEGEVVTVTTAADGAACGYSFEEGGDYLVYAYGEPGELTTGLCTRNTRLADAEEDLAELGPAQREIAAETTK
ncbi:MAG TPA: hypothetical protein VM617_01225 [Thermoanaerobaculia bacterium]|nr:hypothetical protein [Thermoanaerobaculia bacterium]